MGNSEINDYFGLHKNRINPTVLARLKNFYLTMARNFDHKKMAAKSLLTWQMNQTLRATILDRFKFEGISYFGDILISETCVLEQIFYIYLAFIHFFISWKMGVLRADKFHINLC